MINDYSSSEVIYAKKKALMEQAFPPKSNYNIPKFSSRVLSLGIYGGQKHKHNYMF